MNLKFDIFLLKTNHRVRPLYIQDIKQHSYSIIQNNKILSHFRLNNEFFGFFVTFLSSTYLYPFYPSFKSKNCYTEQCTVPTSIKNFIQHSMLPPLSTIRQWIFIYRLHLHITLTDLRPAIDVAAQDMQGYTLMGH